MPSRLGKADLDYGYEFIKRICVGIGPGSPCSSQERARGVAIKNEMEKISDETRTERFVCAPDAFLKWFSFASALSVIAAGFYFFGLLPDHPLIWTTIGSGIAVFLVVLLIMEFILFREFIDGLYPKLPSENIVGIIRPKARRKTAFAPALAMRGKRGKREKRGRHGPGRMLIFGGHHDSALQFNYLRYFKNGYFVAEGILILGVVIFAVGLALRWIALAFSLPWDWTSTVFPWYLGISLPVSVFIGVTFTEREKNGGSVPGAIDNLSAVAILLMIGRVLKRHPELQPCDTEIRLISFGCEEAGARGSRAYVRAHAEELRAAEAVFVNIESIFDPEIEIFTGDRNGTIRNSPDIVQGLAQAARAVRAPSRISHFPFAGGGTDALPFREKGIRAACLFSMKIPSQMVQFYHQPADSYDIVNRKALRNAARIALEYIRRF